MFDRAFKFPGLHRLPVRSDPIRLVRMVKRIIWRDSVKLALHLVHHPGKRDGV